REDLREGAASEAVVEHRVRGLGGETAAAMAREERVEELDAVALAERAKARETDGTFGRVAEREQEIPAADHGLVRAARVYLRADGLPRHRLAVEAGPAHRMDLPQLEHGYPGHRPAGPG